nr:MAG TPA: tail fiber protein [Caudoviricetes sp.]
MAIEDVARRVTYTGNGSQTDFPFSFVVFNAETDIKVFRKNPDEDEKVVPASDFSVTLNADQASNPGGKVVMSVAPGKGVVIAILSNVAYEQTMELTTHDGFDPRTLNKNADRIVAMVQQLIEQTSRALITDPTDTITPRQLRDKLLAAVDDAIAAAGTSKETLAACEAIKGLIERYSWDIPHLVNSLEEVEAYPYDGYFWVKGYGNPGNAGEDISNRVVGGRTLARWSAGMPVVVYASPDGDGDGAEGTPFSLEGLTTFLSGFKASVEVHLADGIYDAPSGLSLSAQKTTLIGSSSAAVILDCSGGKGYGIFSKDCQLTISGVAVRGAALDGFRHQGGSVACTDIRATECGHAGFSALGDCVVSVQNAAADNNAWNGFSFTQGASGNVYGSSATGNKLNGVHANYCGNLYFSDFISKNSGSSGFFLSGCTSVYLDKTETNNNAVAGLLASGLCRVSVQNSSATGNPRGWFAEYGASVTLCDCDTDGGSVGATSGWGGVVAEYGGAVSLAHGSKNFNFKNYRTALYALNGGRIDITRPSSKYLAFTNCTYKSSPAFDAIGNNGGQVCAGETQGVSLLDYLQTSGQVGDAVPKGAADLNNLLDSGVYTCDGSASNLPSGFGQTIVIVTKRAVSNATRKIIQTVYNLSTPGIAIRFGLCPNGDDETVNWGAYTKLATA